VTQSAKKPNQTREKIAIEQWAAGVVAAGNVSRTRRQSQFPQGA